MNRVERLTAILLLLREGPRTSGAIARRFEVSKRTILRDVQALCEMGVPVIAREGAGGGYALPDDYRPAPLPLTANEAFLLLLALGTITGLNDAPFAGERTSLLAKIRALLPARHLPAAQGLLATVAVDVPERAQRAPFLEPLVAAARDGRWVRIAYRSADGVAVRHILPRRLTVRGGLWYCRADVHEHGAGRTYRVDRIAALDPPAADLPAPASSDTRPYDHESHPTIVADLTARGVARVEGEPHLGPLIRRGPDGTGALDFRCPPAELDWFARYFAALGPEAHIRAPDELCARLAELGRQLVGRYGDR